MAATPLPYVIAGILDKIGALTVFLNPCEASYASLGSQGPRHITRSSENRSQLIRIPAARASSGARELPLGGPYGKPLHRPCCSLIEAGLKTALKAPHPARACGYEPFYTAPARGVLEGFLLPARLLAEAERPPLAASSPAACPAVVRATSRR